MKTREITVNRTPERPEGIQIDVVEPENQLETDLLSHLLVSAAREARRTGRIPFELPDPFVVQYQREGTFVITKMAKPGELYQQPRPVAILGIHNIGRQFDLIHAELNLSDAKVQSRPAGKAPQEPSASAEAPDPEPGSSEQ